MQKSRLRAGDVELEVLEAGRGGRPLLLLHGFCGAKENFAEIMGPLAERGCHVVVPDQRGHGKSGHPSGSAAYSFGHFVGDALALSDALGWGRFVLIGHSMGGMTAQLLALGHPERLDALVLMDTSHTCLEIDPEMAAMGRQIVETGGMKALVDVLRGMEGPLVTEAHRRLLLERPDYQEQLEEQNLAASAEMWLSMSDEMFSASDRLGALRTLEVPTVVVVGEQDAPFIEPSRRMAEAIPGARLAVIPGAGHSPQLEATDEWLAEVSGFLDRLPAST